MTYKVYFIDKIRARLHSISPNKIEAIRKISPAAWKVLAEDIHNIFEMMGDVEKAIDTAKKIIEEKKDVTRGWVIDLISFDYVLRDLSLGIRNKEADKKLETVRFNLPEEEKSAVLRNYREDENGERSKSRSKKARK
jgi:hypothetical protein